MKTVIRSILGLLLLLVLTACHDEEFPHFHFITPEPVVVLPTVTPQPSDLVEEEIVLEEEEVGDVEPDPIPEPPCEIVKGNISRNGDKIYHVPGSANYNQVKIDESAGEKFFCSTEEAEAEGWRKPR